MPRTLTPMADGGTMEVVHQTIRPNQEVLVSGFSTYKRKVYAALRTFYYERMGNGERSSVSRPSRNGLNVPIEELGVVVNHALRLLVEEGSLPAAAQVHANALIEYLEDVR